MTFLFILLLSQYYVRYAFSEDDATKLIGTNEENNHPGEMSMGSLLRAQLLKQSALLSHISIHYTLEMIGFILFSIRGEIFLFFCYLTISTIFV